MKHQLSVGQQLWFVPRGALLKPRWITIKKIGRKWAETDYERVDLETLVIDGRGYSSPGKCFVDKAVFDRNRQIEAEYRAIRDFIIRSWSIRPDMTLERLKTIREALGMPEPPRS